MRLLVRLKLLNLVNRKVTSVPLEKSTAPLGGIIWAYYGLEWSGKKYIEDFLYFVVGQRLHFNSENRVGFSGRDAIAFIPLRGRHDSSLL